MGSGRAFCCGMRAFSSGSNSPDIDKLFFGAVLEIGEISP